MGSDPTHGRDMSYTLFLLALLFVAEAVLH